MNKHDVNVPARRKVAKAPRRERGVTLVSLVLFGIVAVMLVVLGMRVIPSVLEYSAAKRAIYKIATSGESNPGAARVAFDRMAAVDDIATISGKDLTVEFEGNALRIGFAYETRVALFGPLNLVIDYRASAP